MSAYPDMDTTPADDPTAFFVRERRAWALSEAEKYIGETVPTQPPLNARGYPVDGWRQPNSAERLQLVLKVARFLLGEEE